MAAYMVIRAVIHDRDAFISGYGPAAGKLSAEFGGEYVVRAPGLDVLEGDIAPGGSMVISRWPSKEAALKFWHSPEYAEVKKLREGIADCDVMLIED